MSMYDKLAAANGGPFGSDGFGDPRQTAMFPSGMETLPVVKMPGEAALPKAPGAGRETMAYGNTGQGDASQGGKVVHGMGDPEHPCGFAGCGFSGRTPHGLARHVHAIHGGFGGLGRRLR